MLAAAALTLSACSSDSDNDDSPKRITVTTQINAMTRVATDTNGNEIFKNDDKISVYAWTGNQDKAPAAADRVVDNSINTLSSGSWVASPQMLWKDTTTPHYFIGVYPAVERDKDLDTDLTQYVYSLKADNQEASDFLVTVDTTGYSASTTRLVPLKFTHMMAKVVINLSFRNQWGVNESGVNVRPDVDSVTICGAAESAKVNLLTKVVTPTGNGIKNIAIPEVEKNTTYSSVFIPQYNVRQVAIVINGSTYNNSAYEWDKYGYWASQESIYGNDKEAYASLFYFHKAYFFINAGTSQKLRNRYVRAVCAF